MRREIKILIAVFIVAMLVGYCTGYYWSLEQTNNEETKITKSDLSEHYQVPEQITKEEKTKLLKKVNMNLETLNAKIVMLNTMTKEERLGYWLVSKKEQKEITREYMLDLE